MGDGLRLVYGAGISRWVANRIPGCERGFDPCEAIGVARGDDLIAGVVFHNFCPEAGVIEVSAAATDPRWFRRDILNKMFGYPFDALGCQMVVARNAEDNDRALRPWRALGAQEYRIPRLRGRDAAEIVVTFTDDQWNASKFKR